MKRRNWLSSLRLRLLALVLLAIIPAFGLILVAAWDAQRRDTSAAQQDALRLAKVASGHQERLIGQARHLLVSLAQLPTVRAGDPAPCQALFVNFLKEFPFYTGFAAAKPDGEVFCAAPPLVKPVSFSDREWYQRLVETRGFVISDYQVGRISGKATIVLAYPVLDGSGQIQGVISSGLDLAWLSQIATQATLPPHSAAIVIDSRGTVLSWYPEPERWVGKTMSEVPIVKTILTQREGVADAIGLDGIARHWGVTRLGGDSGAAYVGIGISRQAALAHANRTLARNLIGLGLVAILALVAAWVGSDLFVLRRMRSLLSATERLASGDWSTRATVSRHDGELGRLERAFNRMAEELDRQFRDLDTTRSQLHAKVFNLLSLNKASRVLTATLDMKTLSETAIQIVTETGRCRKGALYLEARDGECFALAATTSIENERFEPDGEGETSLVETAKRNPHRSFDWHGPTSGENGLVVPLSINEKLAGFFVVQDRIVPEPWTEDDREVLETLAGEVAVCVANARMVTELQERNQALAIAHAEIRQAEVKYRSLVERIPAVTYIAALDAVGCMLYVSPQIEAMTGFSREEWLQDPALRSKRLHPDDRERVLDEYRRAIAESGAFNTEYRLLHREGQVVWTRDEAVVVTDEAGRPEFLHGFLQNITEQKRVQEELQKQREISSQREKLAAMGELLAGVAHELNNPLSVVIGQASLLLMIVKDEALAAKAQKIGAAADRCGRIVKNFLALARQHQPERSEVSLNQVIEETVELLAYQLRVDNVTVQIELADDLPITWADGHQLHQVVVNLITNAHHALRAKELPRRLTLITRRDSRDERVVLEIADTGTGIPPEIIDRIFEPFFTTKPPGQGTGLGLPIVKAIIEEHGGVISVASDPGMGTVFTIELPIGTPPAIKHAAKPERSLPPIKGKRILVVDDEKEIAAVLADLLALDGHEVETAESGRAAVVNLSEKKYDLILTDIRMPVLDGPGLYREVERRDPALGRRFIFVTGDALTPETKEFLKTIGLPCLTKPFAAAEVLRVTQQVLAAEVKPEG